MCRACNEGGRRCPGDTANARRARRYAVARKSAHAADVEKSVRGTPPPVPEATAPSAHDLDTIEGIQARASELRAMRAAAATFDFDDFDDATPEDVEAFIAKHEARDLMEVVSIAGKFHFPGLATEKYEREATALGAKADAWLDRELATEHEAHAEAVQSMEFQRRHGLARDYTAARRKVEEARDAYFTRKRDLMGQLRENGQELVWTDGGVSTPRRVDDTIQRSARLLPADWIAASNRVVDDSNPLVLPVRVRESVDRNHYSPTATTSKRETVPVFNSYPPDDPKVKEAAHSPGRDVITDPAQWNDAERASTNPGDVVVRHYNVARKKKPLDREPGAGLLDDDGNFTATGRAAAGWKQHIYTDEHGVQQTAWRKPTTFTVTVERKNAEVTIPKGSGSAGEDSDVATHELIHRCEDTNRLIPTMEKAFLDRRTADADGEPRDLQEYHPDAPGEMVRPDTFIDRYVGKVYEGTSAHEVMSVGVQAAFYGTHGGFAKLTREPRGRVVVRDRPDDDHHAFVLGTFMSA